MEIKVLDEKLVNEIHLIDKSAFQDFWSVENFLCDINTNTRCYLGVFENNILVGYLALNIVLDESDVIRIAVKKDCQGNGYAKELFNFAFKHLKLLGVTKVMLEVSDINNKAINLYKKLGFKQIFIRNNYYANGSNALIFEKLI